MSDKCGCKKNVNTNRPPGVVPIEGPVNSPSTTIPSPPKNVIGKLTINKRIRSFGSNEELNSVALVLYIFIAFFLVVSIILIFFNLSSYFHRNVRY